MTNYKINIQYGEEDINDIFIKILTRELQDFLVTYYKDQKNAK